uniref:Uncharacterized protein n=1 Tax=Aegilops tauschii subsp. strangulata TaxID=200361 RepID=A0A452ZC85_AEGTS
SRWARARSPCSASWPSCSCPRSLCLEAATTAARRSRPGATRRRRCGSRSSPSSASSRGARSGRACRPWGAGSRRSGRRRTSSSPSRPSRAASSSPRGWCTSCPPPSRRCGPRASWAGRGSASRSPGWSPCSPRSPRSSWTPSPRGTSTGRTPSGPPPSPTSRRMTTRNPPPTGTRTACRCSPPRPTATSSCATASSLRSSVAIESGVASYLIVCWWSVASKVLELGVVVHSLIIGMSLGASDFPSTVRPLVPALTFHQLFEGIGLGGCIVQVRQVPAQVRGGDGSALLADDPGGDRRRHRDILGVRREQPDGAGGAGAAGGGRGGDPGVHGAGGHPGRGLQQAQGAEQGAAAARAQRLAAARGRPHVPARSLGL